MVLTSAFVGHQAAWNEEGASFAVLTACTATTIGEHGAEWSDGRRALNSRGGCSPVDMDRFGEWRDLGAASAVKPFFMAQCDWTNEISVADRRIPDDRLVAGVVALR